MSGLRPSPRPLMIRPSLTDRRLYRLAAVLERGEERKPLLARDTLLLRQSRFFIARGSLRDTLLRRSVSLALVDPEGLTSHVVPVVAPVSALLHGLSNARRIGSASDSDVHEHGQGAPDRDPFLPRGSAALAREIRAIQRAWTSLCLLRRAWVKRYQTPGYISERRSGPRTSSPSKMFTTTDRLPQMASSDVLVVQCIGFPLRSTVVLRGRVSGGRSRGDLVCPFSVTRTSNVAYRYFRIQLSLATCALRIKNSQRSESAKFLLAGIYFRSGLNGVLPWPAGFARGTWSAILSDSSVRAAPHTSGDSGRRVTVPSPRRRVPTH